MDSKTATSTAHGNSEFDEFQKCQGRSIGKLVVCLSEKPDCQWGTPFGDVKFCMHPNAKQLVKQVTATR